MLRWLIIILITIIYQNMKKNILLLLVCLLVANLVHAQKKNIIKFNLVSPVLRAFHLSYEVVLKEKVTAQLGLMYYSGLNISDKSRNLNVYGFAVTPEIRFYPKGKTPTGFFVAASPRYQYYKSTSTYSSGSGTGSSYKEERAYNGIGLGLTAGNQWSLSKVISLEIFGGASINKWSNTFNTTNPDGINDNPDGSYLTSSPIGFRFGVNLGYAF